MKSLYFVRHGQSLANTGAKSMPDVDIPLTECGIHQAQILQQNWQQQSLPNPSHIYASPMLRAKQTAAIFNQPFGLNIDIVPSLSEFSYLSYQTVAGMTGDERAVVAQHYWQAVALDERDGGDADSFIGFYQRVADFRQQIDDFEHNSVFFGHGMWIAMLAWQLMGGGAESLQDKMKFRQFQMALPMYNTVVYRLDCQGEVRQLSHVKLL
ncbi:MAG: histidine phosphatase family protein [Acinetobacter sp.]|nr:histidine phosphatase family protein [Acinetobacter sp.]